MKYTLLILLLFSQSLYAFVGDKGNGGDIVECKINGRKVFKTLDSAIMESHYIFTQINYKKSDKALNAIIKHLDNTLPFMGNTLKIFWRDFENKSSESNNVLWAKAQLRQLADENLIVDIPEYCVQEPIQAVTYISNGKLHRYYYEQKQLDKIKDEGDELSWMIIHEYLRPLIKDADIIRLINGYLHSEEFIADSDSKVNSQLDMLGMESGRGMLRSKLDRITVEARKQAKVFDFKAAKLQSLLEIDYISLSRKEKEEFKRHFERVQYKMGVFHGNLAILDLEGYSDEFKGYLNKFIAFENQKNTILRKIMK